MKARRRWLGWLVAIVVSSAACGGDDETPATPEVHADAGSDVEASHAESSAETAADGSVDGPRNDVSNDGNAIDAPTADTASDAAQSEGSSEAASVDAGLDAFDGSEVSDGARMADVSTEPPVVDAGTDVPTETAADGVTADVDAAADVALESSPDVAEAASVDAFLEADAGAIDDASGSDSAEAEPDAAGDGDASTPEVVHWSIEATPPECSTDPSQVSCTDGIVFEVRGRAGCPTDISQVFVWFPAGGPPAAGMHPVHAASNVGQAFAVTGNEAALEITRVGAPTQNWWAQSGMVEVNSDGSIQFTGVTAFLESNHATTTTLDGFLICGP
jgi:hypothetical protein